MPDYEFFKKDKKKDETEAAIEQQQEAYEAEEKNKAEAEDLGLDPDTLIVTPQEDQGT